MEYEGCDEGINLDKIQQLECCHWFGLPDAGGETQTDDIKSVDDNNENHDRQDAKIQTNKHCILYPPVIQIKKKIIQIFYLDQLLYISYISFISVDGFHLIYILITTVQCY